MSFPELAKRALNAVSYLPQQMSSLMTQKEVEEYIRRWSWVITSIGNGTECNQTSVVAALKNISIPALCIPADGVVVHRLHRGGIRGMVAIQHHAADGILCSVVRDGAEYLVRYGRELHILYRYSGQIAINSDRIRPDTERDLHGVYSELTGLSLVHRRETHIQVHEDGSVYTWGRGQKGILTPA